MELDPMSQEFGPLLESMKRDGVIPDAEKIIGWLRTVDAKCRVERRAANAAQVRLLAFLAKTRREEAERRLHEIMRLPDFPATIAADVLIELYDLPHPRGSLMDWGDEGGLESLSIDEATTYLAVRFSYYVDHMLAHALLEDSGAELPQMRDALLRVGAPGGAELIEKIIAVLPNGGLPGETDARFEYLQRDDSDLEGVVFRLMMAHDYRKEEYFLFALRYEIAHRAGFRRV